MAREIMISGSHGFIGSALSESAKEKRYSVLAAYADGEENRRPNLIVDLAAYGNYSDQKNLREIYRVNVMRLLRLLETTNSTDYKAFIVVGSSSEYGKCDIPMNESLLPHPDSFYAASKVAAVNLAYVWAHEYDKPVVSVRPFSVTGPGEQERHLIPTLIRAAYTEEEIPFVPEPVHDFIDVRDFVDGLWTVIKHAKKIKGEVINIGSGVQYTNEEVKQLVERITHKKINTREVDSLRTYDKSVWVADNFRLKSLGWVQQYTLEDSILAMVKKYHDKP